MAYESPTATLISLPGLPQTVGASGNLYTSTIAMIESHGDDTMAFINGYCARRYSVPFGGGTATGDIPPLIRSIAKDYTGYRVYRSYSARDNVNVNDWVEKLKADAVEALEAIRDGKSDLFDTAGSLISETSGSQDKVDSTTHEYAPTFGEDSVLAWKVDQDKLDELESDRE